MRFRYTALAAGVLLLVVGMTAAQTSVTQDRSQVISQTSSGAPVTSVEDADREVVRYDSSSTPAQPTGQQTASSNRIYNDWRDRYEESLARTGPENNRIYDDWRQRYAESEARAQQARETRRVQTDQRAQEDQRVRVERRVESGQPVEQRRVEQQPRSSVASGSSGQVTTRQSAQTNGGQSGIVQTVVVSIEERLGSMVSQTDVRQESQTSSRSGSVSSQQSLAAGSSGVRQSSHTSAEGYNTATSVEQDSVTRQSAVDGSGQVTIRESTQGTVQGQNAGIAVSQQTGQPGSYESTTRVEDSRVGGGSSGGCITHTHEHGWDSHHDGELHLGAHTHEHTHC